MTVNTNALYDQRATQVSIQARDCSAPHMQGISRSRGTTSEKASEPPRTCRGSAGHRRTLTRRDRIRPAHAGEFAPGGRPIS